MGITGDTREWYVCDGDIRGRCAHKHRTLSGAARCLDDDRDGCATQGGYSDRSIVLMPDNILMVQTGDRTTDVECYDDSAD